MNKIIKKILIIILSICIYSSCSSYKEISIENYATRMEIFRNNFPELYTLYKNGQIILLDVYIKQNKKSKIITNNGVSYRYVYEDDVIYHQEKKPININE